MKNFLHHLEYEFSGLNVEDVKRIIAEKKVFMTIAQIKGKINGKPHQHLIKSVTVCYQNISKIIRIDLREVRLINVY